MISEDIQNIKMILIRMTNEKNGLYLTRFTASQVIQILQDIEDRVFNMERSLIRTDPPPIEDLTNIAFFPTSQRRNKGDAA